MRYDFRNAQSREHLLQTLGVSVEQFNCVKAFDPAEYRRTQTAGPARPFAFRQHQIPKKNPRRGVRIVWEPSGWIIDGYKAAARRLTSFFETTIDGFPHPNCFGYVSGRNIHENATAHAGAAHLLKCDIRDFFSSIRGESLSAFFASLGLQQSALTDLVTFLTIDEALALGLPTSPVVANAFCFEMDRELSDLAARGGAKYTRYADDLSFSSENMLPEVSSIERVLEKSGFSLAVEKTRRSKLGQNHYVTGLSVSDPSRPHAPKSMKRRVRQELYYCRTLGIDEHLSHLGIDPSHSQAYINHLDGAIRYVAFHETALAPKIIPAWQEALSAAGRRVSFEPKNQYDLGFVFHIDETEFQIEDRRYLALGFCVSQHQEIINRAAREVLADFLASPYADGKLEQIRKNGLHFQDASEDLKLKYVEVLTSLPFKGYIVFGRMLDDTFYEKTYLRLLDHVLKRRLMAADSRRAGLYFEVNNKVDQNLIQRQVDETMLGLASTNNRRPAVHAVEFVGKDTIGISTADFLLGSFRKFLLSGRPRTPLQREHLIFERLRDKIRLISDADTGEEFGRRNPIQASRFER